MGRSVAELQRSAVEYDKLSQYLKALSNPNRLEILEKLRFPKVSSEIRLTPKRREDALSAQRTISRQAVEEHLEVLEAIGVVTRRTGQRGGRAVDEYVMNHQHLFAVIEELRKLTALRANSLEDAGATLDTEAQAAGRWEAGPKLVLVSGPWEGKVVPLAGDGTWVLGRRRGAAVALDYDPFVSQENTQVVRDKDGWFVVDLAGSKNGTHLNFAPLPKGERQPLRHGDVVGVGRTLLVFRER